MVWPIRLIFGCKHPCTTWPRTNRSTGRTTVTCLQCGTLLLYNWAAMRQGPVVVAKAVQVQSLAFRTRPVDYQRVASYDQ